MLVSLHSTLVSRWVVVLNQHSFQAYKFVAYLSGFPEFLNMDYGLLKSFAIREVRNTLMFGNRAVQQGVLLSCNLKKAIQLSSA